MIKQKKRTTPRKRPTQYRSRATVDALLVATGRILVRDGYAKLTTTRIAERAGVSIGSLYQFFPTKDALIAALLEREMVRILGAIASVQLPPEARVRDKVIAIIDALLKAKLDNPQLSHALSNELPRVEGLDAIQTMTERTIDLVVPLLEMHRDQLRCGKDLRLAAYIICHALQGIMGSAVSARNDLLSSREFRDQIIALVLGYLVGPEKASKNNLH